MKFADDETCFAGGRAGGRFYTSTSANRRAGHPMFGMIRSDENR
jgi:hypothetical protein